MKFTGCQNVKHTKTAWINFFNTVYDIDEDKIWHMLNLSKLTLFIPVVNIHW
jgi:hypothetical protein